MHAKLMGMGVLAAALLGAVASQPAHAGVAFGIEGGTLGLGAELQVGLTDSLVARFGYTTYKINRTVDQTDATYDGKLKLGNGQVLLDWHPGGHSFKFTVGGVASPYKVDMTGVPVGGSFTLGNNTYPTADISSVTGQLKPGSSFAPYAGLGFGNAVGKGGHLSFLFDLGAVFTGTPKATLAVACATGLDPAVCTQIQAAAAVEVQKLEDKATQFKYWPVLNLGLAYRF